MISWGKWNTLLHFDYFIPSILLINNFFCLIHLLCCIFIYLDFGSFTTIYFGVFIYWKQLNVLELYSHFTIRINCGCGPNFFRILGLQLWIFKSFFSIPITTFSRNWCEQFSKQNTKENGFHTAIVNFTIKSQDFVKPHKTKAITVCEIFQNPSVLVWPQLNLYTVRPRDTRPQDARTLKMHVFE